jgi:hypothetical protein
MLGRNKRLNNAYLAVSPGDNKLNIDRGVFVE